MKKFFISLLAISSVFMTNSCSEDYLDVNRNPNEAYNNQLTPKERLAAAETTLFATQSVTLNRFGNLMMNAWTGNIFQYTAPFDDEMKMNVTSTFYNGIWDNYYLGINNLQAIINSDNPANRYNGHIAVAKILKAYYMQTIVDLYNDAPYGEAFKGQANLAPKYDKGKDIYKNLIKEVDEAMTLLNSYGAQVYFSSATATTSAIEDPIFGTNIANWKLMANTVKLKLLVRLSNCTDPEVIAYRDAALATLPTTATSYISTDVLINPGYSNANSAQQNPLYRNYGAINLANEINSGYRLVLGSANIIDNMLGRATRTSGLVDARVQRMFFANVWNALEGAEITPGFAGYYGLEQGTTNNSNTVGDYVGLGTKQFLITNASTGSSQSGVVLSAAEVQFLLAEAAVVYPSKFSGAQTFFNAGITKSFEYYGLTANATAYINNSNSRPNVGWTASTNKLAAIQYQRWIALTNINPTETFIGYTKTGFPVTPMPINTSATSRPTRLIYPQSEYVANSANVPNLVKSDAFGINQYSPFWLK